MPTSPPVELSRSAAGVSAVGMSAKTASKVRRALTLQLIAVAAHLNHFRSSSNPCTALIAKRRNLRVLFEM